MDCNCEPEPDCESVLETRAEMERDARAVTGPPPCRFCGAPIARDATADWFTTVPSADAPWNCPVNAGGHAPDPTPTTPLSDWDW